MDAHAAGHEHVDPHADPLEHWERRYSESDRIWSGRPNATLVDVAADLPRGRALDLGCGEGADVIWLAQQGWTATGVDLSSVAVGRARAAAADLDLPTGSARFVAADLGTWDLDGGPWDLVTASFLHSTIELPRTQILRRAADEVAAGGHLLVITHAAPPPWADAAMHEYRFTTPEEDAAELALPAGDWKTVRAEVRRRATTSPDGEDADLDDGVLLLRRR
ncbi:class I SAM-dependent methyltransferase [Georgenia sp. Z1491]|uniref:class I SAM-dependent methyltransferase n=1 Tax=Georgenia sp. Z1491 TaxID=3416707 RepID=UPI003CF8602A